MRSKSTDADSDHCGRSSPEEGSQSGPEWRVESLFETNLPRLVHAEQAPEFEF